MQSEITALKMNPHRQLRETPGLNSAFRRSGGARGRSRRGVMCGGAVCTRAVPGAALVLRRRFASEHQRNSSRGPCVGHPLLCSARLLVWERSLVSLTPFGPKLRQCAARPGWGRFPPAPLRLPVPAAALPG